MFPLLCTGALFSLLRYCCCLARSAFCCNHKASLLSFFPSFCCTVSIIYTLCVTLLSQFPTNLVVLYTSWYLRGSEPIGAERSKFLVQSGKKSCFCQVWCWVDIGEMGGSEKPRRFCRGFSAGRIICMGLFFAVFFACISVALCLFFLCGSSVSRLLLSAPRPS